MFKLWQNEAMTTEYGSQGNGSRFQTLNFDAAGGKITFDKARSTYSVQI